MEKTKVGNMDKYLSESLVAVARTYAQQFGEIIGMELDHFVGDDPTDMACFGDCYFFDLQDMRMVVDNLDKYVERYGSKEAVGDEVRAWVDWWLDGSTDDILERVEPRVTHQLRPNISLRSWLDGCPRGEYSPWGGPDAEYLRLLNDCDTLERLILEFRGNRSLANVLATLRTRLAVESQAKEKRDREEWAQIMKGKDWKEFRESIENE